jgi:hypothetical protein
MASLHGKRDPWVAGEAIPGIAHKYNAYVEIVGGPHNGESGWLVSVDPLGSEPVYTVELESRGPDAQVPQSFIRPRPNEEL